jgi:TIR domain
LRKVDRHETNKLGVGSAFKYDVFICHASDDKVEVAGPLAKLLVAKDLEVWYDDFSLHLGDPLLGTIDRGLRDSRFGVVILSKTFFKKKWPPDELNGLIALEGPHRKRVLPIWHKVSQKYIAKFSPILAGRKASDTGEGLDKVVEDILREVERERSRRFGEEKAFHPGTVVLSKGTRREVDHRVHMLDGSTFNHVIVRKSGPLKDLADCPLFLPSYYLAPEFGSSREVLRVESELWGSISHADFGKKIDAVMDNINQLGHYLGGYLDLFWTISDEGEALCGCGVVNLVKALEGGAMGMVHAATTGHSFGTSDENSFIALMSGYCKSPRGLQECSMTMFNSVIPTNPAWIHQVMSPFMDKKRTPETLSYELASAQSREWLPVDSDTKPHKLIGAVGSVKHEGYTEILGALTTNDWFSRESYEISRDWFRGIEIGKRTYPPHPIWGEYDDEWPLAYLDKSIIYTKGRITLEDLLGGKVVGFLPPHVRSFEVHVSGSDLYIIGIEAPALTKDDL